MWEQTRGEGVTVAVLDSGVDASLPHLEGQVMEGADFTRDPEGAHYDTEGHGTVMAGVIAGTGEGGGIQGLAPGAEILPVRVADSASWDFGLEDRFAEAIQYAVDSGAKIINIAVGSEVASGNPEELYAAIDEAVRSDVLIFAAAGNSAEYSNLVSQPANYDGIVGIGAVDRNGDRAVYSTPSPYVALSAPGNDVPGYCPDRSWEEACLVERGGTSVATALTSASAALIWSAHPDWTKNQVLRALAQTAEGDGRRDDNVGFGMIRPDRVILDEGVDPGEPDVNPMFDAYERSLDPPVSPEPVPDEEPAGEPEEEEPADEDAVPEGEERSDASASGAGGDGGGGNAPALIGVIGGLIILGGVAAAVIVNRRRTA
ncbi:S8 family serine peptidase [Streptomyces sp. PT12]|uniref:S8 family serine peptidase n=1 Tax=Streptomyces sp. PT12 TaxID=1510197 RepID=UPI00215C6D72|nr:S8 family serine peptidase [Streptomyces sp. PT12]